MIRVTLTPAYGREYKSKKAALADYNANKDFIVQNFDMPSKPINKFQCDEEDFVVTIRYNKLRSFVIVDEV